jgi:hypothetical protein
MIVEIECPHCGHRMTEWSPDHRPPWALALDWQHCYQCHLVGAVQVQMGGPAGRPERVHVYFRNDFD